MKSLQTDYVENHAFIAIVQLGKQEGSAFVRPSELYDTSDAKIHVNNVGRWSCRHIIIVGSLVGNDDSVQKAALRNTGSNFLFRMLAGRN